MLRMHLRVWIRVIINGVSSWIACLYRRQEIKTANFVRDCGINDHFFIKLLNRVEQLIVNNCSCKKN